MKKKPIEEELLIPWDNICFCPQIALRASILDYWLDTSDNTLVAEIEGTGTGCIVPSNVLNN